MCCSAHIQLDILHDLEVSVKFSWVSFSQKIRSSYKGGTEKRQKMQKEKRRNGKTRKEEKEGQFVSIEKKISKRFGQTILICCVLLGVITSILSYISSISAVSETINSTSDIAADYVAAALNSTRRSRMRRGASHVWLTRQRQRKKRKRS
jgi:hypothetical protein